MRVCASVHTIITTNGIIAKYMHSGFEYRANQHRFLCCATN